VSAVVSDIVLVYLASYFPLKLLQVNKISQLSLVMVTCQVHVMLSIMFSCWRNWRSRL